MKTYPMVSLKKSYTKVVQELYNNQFSSISVTR
jgi:hypothetical protein